ncbi:Microtubule-associated protein, MAP65/Ase1/PRC1 [Artemisia annua]|uniref:Microtubule-associated protein, MAP65/Ase1/PRC1 n=1 Tax=Artemisia annua TaxID=35608 RepID=A0A2U1NF92_ARTAN|nr:Microtubule-associated protein, MAP65/Ase1/PRC1 [Artemisia annua]
MKQQSAKKGGRLSMGFAGTTNNGRLSLGGAAAHATPKADMHSIRGATPNSRTARKIDRHLSNKDDGFGSMPNDPPDGGKYVFSSTLYVSVRRWKNVDRCRKLMIEIGVRKTAMGNVVHEFVAGDSSHPQL